MESNITPHVDVLINCQQDLSNCLAVYNTVVLKPYVVGTKNILLLSAMRFPDTKYVIKWKFDLDGQEIEVPRNCLIEMTGGSLSNGTLKGNNTILINESNDNIEVFTNLEFTGTWIRGVDTDADEEDLTREDRKIKFKDKDYNPDSFSGLGRKYLRKNIINGVNTLTQDMFTDEEEHPLENTIFIILYDYVISNKNNNTINIPSNSILKFEGGSISNGTLNAINGNIISDKYLIFKNINKFTGNWNLVDKWYVEWFGASSTLQDNSLIINQAIDSLEYLDTPYTLYFTDCYYITDSIILKINTTLEGSANQGYDNRKESKGKIITNFSDPRKWAVDTAKADGTLFDYNDIYLDTPISTNDVYLSMKQRSVFNLHFTTKPNTFAYGAIRVGGIVGGSFENVVTYGGFAFGICFLYFLWSFTIRDCVIYSTFCGLYFGPTTTECTIDNVWLYGAPHDGTSPEPNGGLTYMNYDMPIKPDWWRGYAPYVDGYYSSAIIGNNCRIVGLNCVTQGYDFAISGMGIKASMYGLYFEKHPKGLIWNYSAIRTISSEDGTTTTKACIGSIEVEVNTIEDSMNKNYVMENPGKYYHLGTGPRGFIKISGMSGGLCYPSHRLLEVYPDIANLQLYNHINTNYVISKGKSLALDIKTFYYDNWEVNPDAEEAEYKFINKERANKIIEHDYVYVNGKPAITLWDYSVVKADQFLAYNNLFVPDMDWDTPISFKEFIKRGYDNCIISPISLNNGSPNGRSIGFTDDILENKNIDIFYANVNKESLIFFNPLHIKNCKIQIGNPQSEETFVLNVRKNVTPSIVENIEGEKSPIVVHGGINTVIYNCDTYMLALTLLKLVGKEPITVYLYTKYCASPYLYSNRQYHLIDTSEYEGTYLIYWYDKSINAPQYERPIVLTNNTITI